MNKIVAKSIIILSILYTNIAIFAQSSSTNTTPSTNTTTASAAQVASNSATCAANSDCKNQQLCDFQKKQSNNSTIIGASGICVAKCPETPCSEQKPICNLNLGGICTENCASEGASCPSGSVCEETSGVCIASLETCASDEDCVTNSVCDKVTPNNNHVYENQGFGICTPKCTDANSCKFGTMAPYRDSNKNLCNTAGLCVPNCNATNYTCPQDNYCDTTSGACVPSKTCEKSSDCEASMVCNLMAKKTNNQGVISRGGICEPKCPEKKCPTGRPICDLRLGGLCVEDCTTNGYKCPTYSDGTKSLKCSTAADTDKGLCIPDSKSCTLDSDCAADELCDLLSITSEHKFLPKPTGTCVAKCNDTVTCSFNNNTPFRSPEKPKCNSDLGGLCQPDCALKAYLCPACNKCSDSTGLCYNFTDDLIIILLLKGADVQQSEFDQQEKSIRTLINQNPQTQKFKNKIVVTSSNITKYYPLADASALQQNDINIYVIKQSEADKDSLKIVETALQYRPATLLTTDLNKYKQHGRVILNDSIELN